MGYGGSALAEIGAQTAATAVNSVLPGAGALITSIVNLFTSDHAAAVAAEAKTLNAATPTFINEVQQVIAALNSGQMTADQAATYLAQAQQIFYQTVSSIIKQGGPCVSSCAIGTESGAGKPVGWISTEPVCCNNSGTCNASCCLGCYLVAPTVTALTAIIQAGGGSWTIPSSQNNGSIQGTPAVKITYSPTIASKLLPASIAKILPASVIAHPWIALAGIALIGGLFVYGGKQ